MKKFLKLIAVLAELGVLALILIIARMPGMDLWDARDQEITTSFVGDERVPVPQCPTTAP